MLVSLQARGARRSTCAEGTQVYRVFRTYTESGAVLRRAIDWRVVNPDPYNPNLSLCALCSQAPLWGSLVTCVVYCLRVRQC